MFSNRKVESYDTTASRSCCRRATTTRAWPRSPRRIRSGFVDGKPTPKNKVYQLRDGIFEACCTARRSIPPW
jgi:2-oxoisovalerate dehydrogenase E1 component